jgi:hypothetical protein
MKEGGWKHNAIIKLRKKKERKIKINECGIM